MRVKITLFLNPCDPAKTLTSENYQCKHTMTRYIVRDPKGSAEYDNFNPYKSSKSGNNVIDKIKIMDELFKYKDEIDYNSLLFCIDMREVKETTILLTSYEDRNGGVDTRYMTLWEDDNKKAWYAKFKDYKGVTLLFNKFKELKIIDSKYFNSTEFMKCIYNKDCCKRMLCNNERKQLCYIINLGQIVFEIDYNYSPYDKALKYRESKITVPERLIGFISKTQPNLSNAPHLIGEHYYSNVTINACPIHKAAINYVKEHIDEILTDAGFTVEPEPSIEIKYISREESALRDKERRRAELLEELRKLNEEE